MFAYNLRLAKQSLMKQPLLTGLMVSAIGIGVGICMTVLAFLFTISSDPIPSKSDQLFAVRLDSWDAEEPFSDDQPEEAPWELTHTDAVAIAKSPIPTRQAPMVKAVFSIVPENDEIPPFLSVSRMTGRDFFELFEVPFLFGGVWDLQADQNAQNVVVLSKETNEKVFGGQNSVGKEIRMGDDTFIVTGVIDIWNPTIPFHDVNTGRLRDIEDMFMPFSIFSTREVAHSGNTRCWKDEIIDSYESKLASECTMIQFWAELEDPAQVAAYQSWLNAYTDEQRKLGRFQRPNNNRLSDVNEWLKVREIVSTEEWGVLSIAILFLIACLVNTIGLILARFISKAPIIGLRRALGASKTAIFKQHLVEVGLIGFAGGVLGIFLALAGLAGLRHLISDIETVAKLDLPLVALTIAIAIGSAIIAGLYPTWRVCQLSPATYLKNQ